MNWIVSADLPTPEGTTKQEEFLSNGSTEEKGIEREDKLTSFTDHDEAVLLEQLSS